MADKSGGGRRRGYSFAAHLRRMVATRGWRQVAAALGGTAIVAGVVFANCSSDSITGPGKSTAAATGRNSETIVTQIDVGPAVMPATLPPNACNGDAIVWGDTKTNTVGQMVVNTTGGYHLKVHVSQQAQGYGSGQDPWKPRRNYVGSDEYDQEINFTPGSDVVNVEFNLKVIAKGEADANGVTPLFPGDDYMLHMLVPVRSNGQVQAARADTRCQ
jgi:hypothetical protein